MPAVGQRVARWLLSVQQAGVLGCLLEFGGRAGPDGADVLGDDVEGPVPPGEAQQPVDVLVGVPLLQGPGGIAADGGVRGDIGDDDRAGRDDSAVCSSQVPPKMKNGKAPRRAVGGGAGAAVRISA
jgi:hypothetical protein